MCQVPRVGSAHRLFPIFCVSTQCIHSKASICWDDIEQASINPGSGSVLIMAFDNRHTAYFHDHICLHGTTAFDCARHYCHDDISAALNNFGLAALWNPLSALPIAIDPYLTPARGTLYSMEAP